MKEFQKIIRDTYYDKDSKRGIAGTFNWFTEEVGELARAIRKGKDLEDEFADVCAWLFSLANIMGVDMQKATKKYSKGCPKCGKIPCICRE